jgi:nucleotide-binding universal stress UspA family protein
MTYKTIAVHVNESHHLKSRISLAAALAKEHDAHLVGVATTAIQAFFYAPGLEGYGAEELSALMNFSKEGALTALAVFEEFARSAGLNAFEQRLLEDETGRALCLQARYSDLLVVGQEDPEETLSAPMTDALQYVITHSPAPVLFVPYAGKFASAPKRVVIAWNASIESARAVVAALPFLCAAQVVQLAVFNGEQDPLAHGALPGADIALFLARHGVKVEVSQQTTADGADIGNALLSHLSDFGADLLVMGGFGHSRFREMVLGGVTRSILKTMTVPVLMAH